MRASHKNEINIMNNQLEVIKKLKDENAKLRLENAEKDKMIKMLEDRVSYLATKLDELCKKYLNKDLK